MSENDTGLIDEVVVGQDLAFTMKRNGSQVGGIKRTAELSWADSANIHF